MQNNSAKENFCPIIEYMTVFCLVNMNLEGDTRIVQKFFQKLVEEEHIILKLNQGLTI